MFDFITTTLLLMLVPKRILKFLSINTKKIEAGLLLLPIIGLSIYSVEQQDFISLGLSFSVAIYLFLFYFYGDTFGVKITNTIKLHNVEGIKRFKNINYSISKTFFILKAILVISVLEYLFNATLYSYILFVFGLLMLFSIVLVLKSKSINIQTLIDTKCQQELFIKEPKIVFYFTAPNRKFLYHIKMWTPYIKQTGIEFFIMTRESSYIKQLTEEVSDIPIVVAKSLSDIEFFLPQSVSVALYANNGTKNTHLVRFNHIEHIQMLHGDSEKPPSFNPVSKMYDKLFVSGQRAIDRYYENGINIDKNNFKVIGRPQVSNIDISDKSEIKTVLIAPTWKGFHSDTQFSSLYDLIPIIEYIINLNQGIKIIFRKHPLTDTNTALNKPYFSQIETILENDSIEHIYCSDREIVEDFNDSDCIITDISSVPIDYLYSEKPIIHYDTNNLSHEFQTNIIYKEYAKAVYIIDKEYDNMDLVFKDINTINSLYKQRKIIKKYYHGDFDKPLGEVFNNAILESVK